MSLLKGPSTSGGNVGARNPAGQSVKDQATRAFGEGRPLASCLRASLLVSTYHDKKRPLISGQDGKQEDRRRSPMQLLIAAVVFFVIVYVSNELIEL